MNKTKIKSRISFFFSLVCTLLLSACGVRNFHGFVDEDARFANYTFLGTDGDGSTGLAYYADETNPDEIAVAIGTCEAQDITVSTYDGKPVTSVFPSGFLNCDTIRTITLPDTVTVFGTDAFAGSSLQTIAIPNGLTVISSGAFRNCKELVEVEFDKDNNSVATINDYAFANDFKLSTFPFHKLAHLTSIGKEAFLYCLGLRSVIFPNGFTTLASYAFQDCKGLTTIYFPDSIASIGFFAFRGVGETAKIYFSGEREDVVSALDLDDAHPGTALPLEDSHNYSFASYHVPIVFGVGELIIDGPYHFSRPEGGTYDLNLYNGTGDGVWADQSRPEYTETIKEDEVILWNYEDDGVTTSLNIPSTIDWGDTLKVVGIKNNVFRDNTRIQSVTFNENLRFIDAFAFAGCTNLTEINLKGALDLQHIQAGAFYDTMPHNNVRHVDHMYEIHIPANVINIGAGAFGSCDGIYKIYFDGATNEYEETFYAPGGTANFVLPYEPTAVTSVTVDGPEKAFSRNGKTITISSGNLDVGSIVKVKYTTDSTTTQTFEGYKVGINLVSEFTLSSKAEVIASVTVDGVAQALTDDYTVTTVGENENTKTKITFNSAPDEGAEIVVTYRALPKLTKIDAYAFVGCSNGLGSAKFHNHSFILRETIDPFPNIYFPASLTEIGQYAFAKGEFIGGAIFKSPSLIVRNNAFHEQKCLSEIVFPTDMTKLDLYEKSFASGLSINECAAGNMFKKLISVTLPASTTVYANDVFHGHVLLSIYCINNKPTVKNSKNDWNRIAGATELPKAFGDFKYPQNQMDKAPVYVVASASDIVSVPSKEHPIFDFVKEKEQTFATLTNYHYYGGRIMDANGNTAIKPRVSLVTYNNTGNINPNYSSEYAVMISTNNHFRAEVPIQVRIGGEYLTVKKIGQSALAMQTNEKDMKPNTGSKTGKNYRESGWKYWQDTYNYWTMREITIPDTVEEIGAGAFAFIPFTTLKTYELSAAKTSNVNIDGSISKIWNGPSGAISNNGKFPSNLKKLGRMACSFSGLTVAQLPNGLTEFNGINSTTAPSGDSWKSFPFIGCFDLGELSIYDVGAASPVFSSNGSVISYASTGVMIEGAEGMTTMNIPWGTLSISDGALRGGRQIETLNFPYTVKNISNYFMDTIGSSVDSSGWSGTGNLKYLTFQNAAQCSQDDTQKETYATPKCTTIGESAFWGCTSLLEVELPVSLTTIGPKAFRNCSGITQITVDNGTSDTSPFTPNAVSTLNTDLDLTKLPNLTFMDFEAFAGCSSLTSVTTSSHISSLSKDTFKDCTKITSVTIDAATTTLNEACFSGCTRMATLTFNGTGVTFGKSCFNNCDALTRVTIPNNSILNETVFNSCDGLDDGVGVIVGTGVTFKKGKDSSAFLNCPTGTKIYLMEDEATYISRKNNNKYAEGWNFRSYSNGAGTPLDFYCFSATQPETTSTSWGYWHWENDIVGGTPKVWTQS